MAVVEVGVLVASLLVEVGVVMASLLVEVKMDGI